MKNYLGKTKEVKAPVRWKSSPDAPDTQLAYITQPEIDMLVQANIHNSMNGKPNMGPKGIISLDGGKVACVLLACALTAACNLGSTVFG